MKRADPPPERRETSLGLCCRWGQLLLVVLVSGCPTAPRDEDPAAPPSVEAPIAVVVPRDSSVSASWKLAAAEWEAARGVACRVDVLEPSSGGMPEMAADAALLAAPLPLVPELIDAGWIAPPDRNADPEVFSAWQDLFRGLQDGVASAGKQPALIPLECPVLVCCYRADLLEAAGRRPPETWSDYQLLLDELPDWAPGLSAVEPWSEEFRASMFLARAVPLALHPDNVSLYLDAETGAPAIGEPPFVQALDGARQALARLDRRSLELGPRECFREVLAGRAALAVALPAEFDAAERPEDGRIGFAPLPGADRVFHRQIGEWVAAPDGAPNRVTLVGFGGLAACVSSRVAEPARRTAWRVWLEFDAHDATTADGALLMHRLCRASIAVSAAPNPPSDWRTSEWRDYVKAVTVALDGTRTAFDLPFPHRAEFRGRLTTRLSEAIEGTTSAAEALERTSGDWQALCEELGIRRVLNTARQCSGLSPLPPD